MNVMIAATLRDKSEEFLLKFKSLCQDLGLDFDEHAALERTYFCVGEPLAAEVPLAAPTEMPSPVDEPAGMEMSIELPQDEPIVAPTPEIPALELPVAEPEVPPTLTPELPPAEPELPTTTNQVTDCGPHVILSLLGTVEVPTIVDITASASRLEVMTDVVSTPDGLLNFWFGNTEFRIPRAIESANVQNPEHQIQQNTIRIVASSVASGQVFAALVDVVRGEADKLVLAFDNNAG